MRRPPKWKRTCENIARLLQKWTKATAAAADPTIYLPTYLPIPTIYLPYLPSTTTTTNSIATTTTTAIVVIKSLELGVFLATNFATNDTKRGDIGSCFGLYELAN